MPRDVDVIRLILPEHKWASSIGADVALPDNAAIGINREDGWGDDYSRVGGTKPQRELINQLMREFSAAAIEMNRHGCGLEWDARISYLQPAIIAYDDVYYISVKGDGTAGSADNNLNKTPSSTSEGFWVNLGNAIRDATTSVKGVVSLATVSEVVAGTNSTKAVTPASLQNANESGRGLVTRATQSEAQAGSDNAKYMTPLRTKEYIDTRTASETEAGLVERATQPEVNAGTDEDRYVSPKTLAERLDALDTGFDIQATTSTRGIIELATDSEAQSMSSGSRAVTPNNLDALTATESRRGMVERASQSEAQGGSDNSRYMTSLRTKDYVDGRTATTSRAGISERATQSEVDSGTDISRYVTPETLEGREFARNVEGNLADASTVDWDVSDAPQGVLTLGGNRTLGLFTGAKEGGFYILRVKQPSAGSHNLSLHSDYDRGELSSPNLSNQSNETDYLAFSYFGGKRRYLGILKGYSA